MCASVDPSKSWVKLLCMLMVFSGLENGGVGHVEGEDFFLLRGVFDETIGTDDTGGGGFVENVARIVYHPAMGVDDEGNAHMVLYM